MTDIPKEQLPSRDQLLEALNDAAKRRQEAEDAKKRDAKLHAENLTAIKDEISELLIQLHHDA